MFMGSCRSIHKYYKLQQFINAVTNSFGCSGFYHFVEYLIVLGLAECFCDLQQHDSDSEPSRFKVREPVF